MFPNLFSSTQYRTFCRREIFDFSFPSSNKTVTRLTAAGTKQRIGTYEKSTKKLSNTNTDEFVNRKRRLKNYSVGLNAINGLPLTKNLSHARARFRFRLRYFVKCLFLAKTRAYILFIKLRTRVFFLVICTREFSTF